MHKIHLRVCGTRQTTSNTSDNQFVSVSPGFGFCWNDYSIRMFQGNIDLEDCKKIAALLERKLFLSRIHSFATKRVYIRQGEAIVNGHKRRMFLFNDLLLKNFFQGNSAMAG
jgi:hypothetical protein